MAAFCAIECPPVSAGIKVVNDWGIGCTLLYNDLATNYNNYELLSWDTALKISVFAYGLKFPGFSTSEKIYNVFLKK